MLTRLRRVALGLLLLGHRQVAIAQGRLTPGSPDLKTSRVRLATDTIVVVVVRSAGPSQVVARLVRRLESLGDSSHRVFRETQRYEYSSGDVELDTLEVSAQTLALLHIAEISTHTRNVLTVDGQRLRGSVTPTDSTSQTIDIAVPASFHDMMLEAFIGAFPIRQGASLEVPTLRPPSVDVRIIGMDVDRATDTLNVANGRVECLVVRRRARDVVTWVDRLDGHVVRMRWSNADGSVTWKLPQADLPFIPSGSGSPLRSPKPRRRF